MFVFSTNKRCAINRFVSSSFDAILYLVSSMPSNGNELQKSKAISVNLEYIVQIPFVLFLRC
jgi:hypothetical protein